MALNYDDVARFAAKHGNVAIIAGEGAKVTILKSGELDAHALIEAKTTHFVHDGKSYTADAFEKLVRASRLATDENWGFHASPSEG
jgi:hypothetical protein